MAHALSDAALATVAFSSTNLDNLLLLIALFSSGLISWRVILVGQYLGLSLIILSSLLLGSTIRHLPTLYEHLLGVIPLAIGIRGWWTLFFAPHPGPIFNVQRLSIASRNEPLNERTLDWTILNITGFTVAVGVDNVAAYSALFATTPRSIVTYVTVFGVLTTVWCALGYFLVNNPMLSEKLHRAGTFMLPTVMTVVGLWLLVRPKLF